MRYVVKHKPTNKVYCEDEGGAYLIDPKDGCFSWGQKKDADRALRDLQWQADDNNGNLFTEDGEFPIGEFAVDKI